jgi:hypothetical protein
MDLLASGGRTGYLLKTRVTDVSEFGDTLKRIERGGSAVDSGTGAGTGGSVRFGVSAVMVTLVWGCLSLPRVRLAHYETRCHPGPAHPDRAGYPAVEACQAQSVAGG